MSSHLFGLDLTYKSVEKDITKKEEVLVAFIHWFLVKRGFRCIGVGEDKNLVGNEVGSELLPAGWNVNENYTLRYLLENELFILHCILSEDGNLLFNLMKASDLSVSNVAIHNIDKTVIATTGNIQDMIPNYKDLMHVILRDLVETYYPDSVKSTETQTNDDSTYNQPRRSRFPTAEDLIQSQSHRQGLEHDWSYPDVQNIGRSDLDPFAAPGIGGGMIFNPFGTNRGGPINPGLGIPGLLPRGAVPPGARFDPMGPPRSGMPPMRRPPDSDHLPPPGYSDMFM